MKKLVLLLTSIAAFSSGAQAQGHDIKINLKGAKDTMAYLVKYTWDQKYIADTCKKVKNGVIEFKGKNDLDKGVYVLVSDAKSIYFDLFVNENQKFTINTDASDIVGKLTSVGNKENEQFFSYIKYITGKNQDFNKIREEAKGKNKTDSAKFVSEKLKTLNEDVRTFEKEFMVKVKGTYLYDVLNLKTDKEAPANEVPKMKNNRPDSIFQYYYYKNHYFDGINFKDERIIRTPFFADRIKKYFESVILQHPDTVIVEIDKIMAKCDEGNLIYNLMLGYFTYKYEQSKIMGFDKVFIHVADKYIISGRAKGVYTEETVNKIKERTDIMRNLLLDAKVADLFMIDSVYARQVRKMGFDTASSSKSITDLYYKNLDRLTPLFRTLYSLNAKYTILIFWAADCGHCQTEIPKLHKELEEVKGKLDYKVYAVQTKDELVDKWTKFIIENKLGDWMNVVDPIHLNNLKERFDIYSTPVIYVLDKDKKIKAKRLGADQVVPFLKTLELIEKENNKANDKK